MCVLGVVYQREGQAAKFQALFIVSNAGHTCHKEIQALIAFICASPFHILKQKIPHLL